MSPVWKTQLFRILRLFGFAFVGVLIPFAAGLHGIPTFTAIEAVMVAAGEAGFRAMFPAIQTVLADPPTTPAENPTSAVPVATAEPFDHESPVHNPPEAPPVPPAVF